MTCLYSVQTLLRMESNRFSPPDDVASATLDTFHTLRIGDPLARAPSAGPSLADLPPRAGTAMSESHALPRHMNSLPARPHPMRIPSQQRHPEPSYLSDDASIHSGGSTHHSNTFGAGNDTAYTMSPVNDHASVYQREDAAHAGYSPSTGTSYRGYDYDPSPPPNPYAPAAQPGLPRTGEYNPLYVAASDVLGMGPPPGPPLVVPAYASGSGLSLVPPSSLSVPTEPEFEPRPPIERNGTTASVTLSTLKKKAVDLRAPPYTKEYIDGYRQRIKADPDPEAHFAYAKYLIDAAKKIGADAKDQRAGQPYDEAQFFLANCYGTGTLGLQVDHEKAYHLYLQAAKQNHAAATYRVAVCNEIGAGTRKEPPRAAAFYRKAASLGDTAAMYKLGMILLQGTLGEAKNPREAVGWLRRAAEQADEENPHALHELALLHENPSGQIVPHDPIQAKELYTRAAYLGYTQSQYKLGQCYEYGALACPVDPRRSIAWYTKAAEKGNSEAELALSGWYLTGSEGVLKQSDSEAYLWARRAADKGLTKAEYAVGYYAEVGIGIKQDIEFAKRWYMRAAAQGNKRAMNRLTEMKRQGNKRANVARPTRQQAKDECVVC
ncbi:HCP-like protein [Auriscalpium vulgare]|uniref:HCP-like protein n=1 Tax=Auriscalpium vulgare TaxID=40419 RepID=A0ACB8RWR0_9AGAM|nr:HCP-like protein [Auriscalpium vulgare]